MKLLTRIANRLGFVEKTIVDRELENVKSLEAEVLALREIASIAKTQFYVLGRCKMYLADCLEKEIGATLQTNCKIAIDACDASSREYRSSIDKYKTVRYNENVEKS